MNVGEDARELVELRIHGVSGTTPESMLNAHFTNCVSGDAGTGIYAADPDELVPRLHPDGRDRRLEGYSWRGMTSGAPTTALWVLFAPFALANTVAAMRPPRAGDGRARWYESAHGVACRLLAVSLTVTFVMATFIVSVDEVAWQCGNNAACVKAHSVTGFLGWSHVADPARRVAILLVVPLVVVLLLWWRARRAWQARNAVLAVIAARGRTTPSVGEAQQGSLADPALWADGSPSEVLRHCHVATTLATVTALTAVGLGCEATGSIAVFRVFGVAASLLLAAAVILCAVGRRPSATSKPAGTLWLPLAALALLVAQGAYLIAFDPTVATPLFVVLPGIARTIEVVFCVQLALVLCIAALGAVTRARNRAQRVGMGGLGGGIIAGLAVMLGALFSAGIVLRVGDFLGQLATPAMVDAVKAGLAKQPLVVPAQPFVPPHLILPAHPPIALANALVWTSRGAILGAVVIVIALAIALWLCFRRESRKPLVVNPDEAVGDPAHDGDLRGRDKQMHTMQTWTSLTDDVGRILLVPAIIATLLAITGAVIVVVLDVRHRIPAFESRTKGWSVIIRYSTSWGSWLITAFAVALVGVVLAARTNDSLRRSVGILWDLTTFWPRHAHPLGPPCYSDRAVPEYLERTVWHVRDKHRDVILSGHSQGTIIAAPVILRLDDDVREHVAFVSYGSPLQRLYATWFPAFYDMRLFDAMSAQLGGRWTNLHRTTDPIGGVIDLAPNGPWLREVSIPPSRLIPDGGVAYPPIRIHSDYPAEPQFDDAIAQLDAQLGRAGS